MANQGTKTLKIKILIVILSERNAYKIILKLNLAALSFYVFFHRTPATGRALCGKKYSYSYDILVAMCSLPK